MVKSTSWPFIPTGAILTLKNNSIDKNIANNPDDNNPEINADNNNPEIRLFQWELF
jgi:hypothetical protein